jgi:rod shape-determining protein MreD
VKALGVLIAIALSLALQTTLAGFLVGGTTAVDLVLVVVVYIALTMGPGSGMLAGSAAGIIQDALSSGVIGVGGLAKSIVGFAAGVIGQQFIVTAALPRLVMFMGATAAHAAIFMGFYVVLGLRSFPSPWVAIVSQALGNALVGIIAFSIIEGLPGVIERRRMRRRL